MKIIQLKGSILFLVFVSCIPAYSEGVSREQAEKVVSQDVTLLNRICKEEKTIADVKRKGRDAILSMAQVNKQGVSKLLTEYGNKDVDWKCRLLILEQLSNTGDARLIDVASVAVSDEKIEMRRMGFAALGLSNNPRAVSLLNKGVEDADVETRVYSVKGLANLKLPESGPRLAKRFSKEQNFGVRMGIVEALGSFTDKDSHAVILQSLQNDPSPEVRARSAWILGEIKAQDAIDALMKALDDSYVLVGLNSAQALGKIKSRRAIPALLKALNKEILGVEAASALGEIGDVSAIEPLMTVKSTKDAVFNAAVEKALKKLNH